MDNLHKNYLEHHGILGMRWGRKMGPPYPLDASDHSAAEKKEGYKKSIGGGRNESLYDRKAAKKEARKEKYSNKANIHDRAANAAYRDADDLKKNGFKKEAEAVRKVGDKQKVKADRKRELQIEGKMTGKQKAVVAGAGTLAAISLLQSKNNIALANEILGDYGKVALKEVIGKSAVAAGKAAVIGGLGTYGAIKVGDLAKTTFSTTDKKKPPMGAKIDGPTWEDHEKEMKRLERMGAKIDGPTNFDPPKNAKFNRPETESQVLRDLNNNYDKSDPDYKEAMELLKELNRSKKR